MSSGDSEQAAAGAPHAAAAAAAWVPAIGAEAVAEHDFETDSPLELSFRRGQILLIVEANPTRNWWKCQNSDQEVGYVPKGFLAQVRDNGAPFRPTVNPRAPSLSEVLKRKLESGDITPDEHAHIVRVSVAAVAPEELPSSTPSGNSGPASLEKRGRLEAPDANDEPLTTALVADSRAPRRDSNKSVEAVYKALAKIGITRAVAEKRLEDLVGFGFDRVEAARTLRSARGDIAVAMELLIDST